MGGFTIKRSSFMESVAILVLCALFAVLAIGAIATGVNAYTGTTALVESTNTSRTALAYISNQLRQYDSAGMVAVGRIFGEDALVLREIAYGMDGEEYEYCTYIYCSGGWLRELYTEAGLEGDMIPDAGTGLVALTSASFSEAAQGLIQVTVRHQGVEASPLLTLSARAGEVTP